MYVIYYTGPFQGGHLKIIFWGKSKRVRMNSLYESLEFASKFRFKFIANLVCRLYNWDSEQNFKLITFKVEKV